MIVIPPINILENAYLTLISCSIIEGEEGDPSLWVKGSAYSEGDQVRTISNVGTPGKIYEALTDIADSQVSPNIDILAAVPQWTEVGLINKWRMFDSLTSTITTSSMSISVSINPGDRVNTLGLLNVSGADTLDIYVYDANNVEVYSDIGTPISNQKNVVVQNLPMNLNYTYTININTSSTVNIGSLILGKAIYIGDVQTGVKLSSLNFSQVNRDTYGVASLTRRRDVARLDKKLLASIDLVPTLVAVRDVLNAVPALWIGMENNVIPNYFDSLVIQGFYRSFNITIESELHAIVQLELEEV